MVREGLREYTYLIKLMQKLRGDRKNHLEKTNIKVDKDHAKAMGMVNTQARKVWRFSGNEFCKNICCLVSAPTFGIGGSRIWDK